jgi:hypothetical protein
VTRFLSACAIGLLTLIPVPSAAQTAPPAEAPTSTAAATSGPVLRAGTKVSGRTLAPLSSKTARQGQRFDVEIVEPVLVDGAVVVPAGVHAVGEVTRVVQKDVFGQSGKLEVRLLFVEIGGARIRLDGFAADKGKGNTAALVVGLPLVGFGAGMISGKSAVLPVGTIVDGVVAQDLPLRPAG